MTPIMQSFHQTRAWLLENPQNWLRPLFVMGVLVITAGIGLTGSTRLIQLAFLGIIGLIGVYFFWRWSAISLILTVAAGMFIEYSGPSGINVTVLGVALLLGIWAFEIAKRTRSLRWMLLPSSRPLIALIIVTFLAFLVGQLPWFPIASPAPMQAQIGGVLIFVFLIGAFFLAAHYIYDTRWLQWFCWMFMGLGAIHLAGWLVPGVGSYVGGIFANGTTNNAMFWLWLVAIGFSQALINTKLHIGWRVALAVVALAALYVGFALNSGWKSGYLPSFVTLAAIFGFRYPKLGIFLGVAGIVPAQFIFSQAVSTDVYSFVTRFDALVIMLELAKENPLLGFGPANYYWYVPLYRIRGYASVFSSHNQYLDLLAQVGILGTICVFWFAIKTGWIGWKLRHKVSAGFEEAYVYGALGGLVGSMAAGVLADWLIPFVYNIGFTGFRATVVAWIFLGGLIALHRQVNLKKEDQY